MGVGKFSDQRGFAGVGKTDQSDIGNAAQFEIINTLFAVLAQGVFDRCAIGGCLEIPVALAALAAAAENEFLIDFR